MILSEIIIPNEIINELDIDAILATVTEKKISAYSEKFKNLTTSCKEEHKPAFILLGAISSLYLNIEKSDNSFQPQAQFQHTRTAATEDFSDSNYEFFEKILQKSSDPELNARIADVLWSEKRQHKYLDQCIDDYISSAKINFDINHWPYSFELISRALQLAKYKGKKKPTKLDNVVKYIEEILEEYRNSDPLFMSLKLITLLFDLHKDNETYYARLCQTHAERAENEKSWSRSRDYWRLKSKWDNRTNEAADYNQSWEKIASSYEKEAAEVLLNEKPSYIRAAGLLTQAIESLRKVPDKKEEIEEIHSKLLEYQKKSLKEFGQASTEIDLSPLVDEARNLTQNRPKKDALFYLAFVTRVPRIKDIKDRVENLMAKSFLQHLTFTSVVNKDGKVMAHKPSILSDDEKEKEAALRAEMISNTILSQQVSVQGYIQPARYFIQQDHKISEYDLYQYLHENPFVPEDRILLFAKGLHAGLQGDFIVAAHLLIPQIENSIRVIYARQGFIPSTFDSKGTQKEYDLNKLLYEEDLKKILGEDLVFTLQGLLVEQVGSNFRNSISHGLLSDKDFFTVQAIYVWWLTLRLCLEPMTHLASKDLKFKKGQ